MRQPERKHIINILLQLFGSKSIHENRSSYPAVHNEWWVNGELRERRTVFKMKAAFSEDRIIAKM